MNKLSRPPRETADQRQDRQAAFFRELTEMSMDAARIAHLTLKQAHVAAKDTHKPNQDLNRATRGVVASVKAENDVYRTQRAPRAAASDNRRAPLCTALLKAAKTEPDPVQRAALTRDIPDLVEETLIADPNAETPIEEHLYALADQLHLNIDPATLPDEVLGIEPKTYIRDD